MRWITATLVLGLVTASACVRLPPPTLEAEGRVAHYGSQLIDHVSSVQEAVAALGRRGVISTVVTLDILARIRAVGVGAITLADALTIIDTARGIERTTAIATVRATLDTIKADVATLIEAVTPLNAGAVAVAIDLALGILGDVETAVTLFNPAALPPVQESA